MGTFRLLVGPGVGGGVGSIFARCWRRGVVWKQMRRGFVDALVCDCGVLLLLHFLFLKNLSGLDIYCMYSFGSR